MYKHPHPVTLLISAVVLVFSQVCSADVPEQLRQFETYKWYPAQAKSICQQISADYPASDYALQAHRNLVISYVLAERYSDAQQKLNQMSTVFAGNSGLPAALYEIARVYERLREYAKAKNIYQQITQNHAGSSEAKKALLSSSRMAILAHIDNKTDASAAIEQLITDFSSHSELPSSLYDIARRYERAKLYKDAENLYQRIIQQYGGSPAAEQARLGVRRSQALSHIESKDYEQAVPVINSMLVDFAGHPDLPEALYDIGIRYERAGQYQQARDVYRQITQGYPTSSHASRAQIDSAKISTFLLIDPNDPNAAQQAIDLLVSGFTGHCYLPEVLSTIARKWQDRGRFQQAKLTYEQIIQQDPTNPRADQARLDARKCQVLSDIEAGSDSAAQAGIDSLVADYTNHPGLPWVLNQIAQKYQNKYWQLEGQGRHTDADDKMQKSLVILEMIINQLPASTAVPVACDVAGEYYRTQEDYVRSLVYYERIVNDYPDYYKVWNALFMVAQNISSIEQLGVISSSEAELQIKAAYKQIVERYPGCPAAKHAQDWLKGYALIKGETK